jgi:sulfur carrier protein
MALQLTINGLPREFAAASSPTTLDELIAQMDLKADRVAVELNGLIAPRTGWPQTTVESGDRLEIVHFVGGGA